jgi:hypothetical protein
MPIAIAAGATTIAAIAHMPLSEMFVNCMATSATAIEVIPPVAAVRTYAVKAFMDEKALMDELPSIEFLR